MAEAGPSSAAARHVHSQPPDEYQDGPLSQANNNRTERVASMTSLGMGHPSSSSRRLTNSSRVSSQESNGSRRRVRSVEDALSQPGPSRLRQLYDLEIDPSKRASSSGRRASTRRRDNVALPTAGDASTVPFSDEYDLCTSHYCSSEFNI